MIILFCSTFITDSEPEASEFFVVAVSLKKNAQGRQWYQVYSGMFLGLHFYFRIRRNWIDVIDYN